MNPSQFRPCQAFPQPQHSNSRSSNKSRAAQPNIRPLSASIQHNIPENSQNLSLEAEEKDVQELCVICLSKVADYLVVPCGHQCGCETCLNVINKGNKKCPICNTKIDALVKVFRSGVAGEVEQEEVVKKNVQVAKPHNIADKENFNIHTNKMIEKNNIINDIYDDKYIENNIVISVAPCEDMKNDSKANMGITIKVPDTPIRRPVDVCCVIDISGSMGSDAKFQDPEDETKTKTDGMSILDLVKHAVKTVINTLSEKDRLSIVTFDDRARMEYKLEVMNENGRKKAVQVVDALAPLNSTDIWAGLELGLESLRHTVDKTPRRKFVFLLTDGQPVQSPQEGEHGALSKYFDKYPQFTCQVNTFGFGYDLKSSLLLNVATFGGGIFSFIPDAKILGTNFVNCIANAVTTLSLNAKLHLFPLGGSSFTGDVGGNVPFKKIDGKDGFIVKLGNLQYGQTRDLIVPMVLAKKNEYLAVILEYEGYEEGSDHKITYIATNRQKNHDSVAAYARNLVVNETLAVIDDYSHGKTAKGTKSMKSLCDVVGAYDTAAENEEPRLNGLFLDLVGSGEVGGRMSKAVSTAERFNRWGQHYLRSISRAHQVQLRTNFIDVGLQVYGGETFKELQELGGSIFLQLPMKKSKLVENIQHNQNQYQNQYQYQNYNQSNQNNPIDQSNQISTVDNTTYYAGSGGGCFHESCFVDVLTSDGRIVKTQLSHLKKNDLVSVVDNNGKQGYARILCVVKIRLDKTEKLVEFSSTGLKITQKHPVWFDSQWQFPIDIATKYKHTASLSNGNTNYVYNFILEHSHVLLVNNMRCVTFGHGIKEAYHPFYGTNAVIDALKTSSGFDKGFVSVNGNIRHLVI